METSSFSDLVKLYFGGLVTYWVSQFSGEEKSYYYDRWFPKEYSPSGDFSSVESDNSQPMAYVIDYDSPLPLIKGEAIKVHNGEIPKIGVEIQATEKKLTEMNDLSNRGKGFEPQLVQSLFKPVKKVYIAQKERLEWMALQLLSLGYAETSPLVNTGTNIRIEANYPAGNLMDASVVWGAPGYTPLTDLETLQTVARGTGNAIVKFLLDRNTFNQIRNSDEAKQLYNPLASAMPGLNVDQLNEVTLSQYGFTFEVIDRMVTIQKNGKDTKINPWEAGQVVGVSDESFGATVWAELAEARDPVGGVDYQIAEEFILLRKYKVAHPAYGEFTSSQSRSACVLKNPSSIFKLDTTKIS